MNIHKANVPTIAVLLHVSGDHLTCLCNPIVEISEKSPGSFLLMWFSLKVLAQLSGLFTLLNKVLINGSLPLNDRSLEV